MRFKCMRSLFALSLFSVLGCSEDKNASFTKLDDTSQSSSANNISASTPTTIGNSAGSVGGSMAPSIGPQSPSGPQIGTSPLAGPPNPAIGTQPYPLILASGVPPVSTSPQQSSTLASPLPVLSLNPNRLVSVTCNSNNVCAAPIPLRASYMQARMLSDNSGIDEIGQWSTYGPDCNRVRQAGGVDCLAEYRFEFTFYLEDGAVLDSVALWEVPGLKWYGQSGSTNGTIADPYNPSLGKKDSYALGLKLMNTSQFIANSHVASNLFTFPQQGVYKFTAYLQRYYLPMAAGNFLARAVVRLKGEETLTPRTLEIKF